MNEEKDGEDHPGGMNKLSTMFTSAKTAWMPQLYLGTGVTPMQVLGKQPPLYYAQLLGIHPF